ncbi:MAG TPA: sugar phosphate isomerase/epimerase family protein [Sedimentisphaerales bacterium]|nr:sugar phosphate isomerase/epimerase family protein [Sedimentisphaerales bacterium]
MNRRKFLGMGIGAVCGFAAGGAFAMQMKPRMPFRLSLAQWSFNKALFGKEMDNLDFAKTAHDLGFEGLEYVNSFFKDKANDKAYLGQMKKLASDNNVKSLLIMCDGEGFLGDPDCGKRTIAVENHYRWLEAAKFLGCHSIRVNAHSEGTYEEQQKLAADGLAKLSEEAKKYDLNVIVENHGGLSSNGKWMSEVMKMVNMPNCGMLPDFGNFDKDTDRYEAVKMLMPYAKGVSAKSNEFDANGDEINTDYYKMMKIVLDSGYNGFVGVEYEGSKLSEKDGVIATRDLLIKIRNQYI